MFSESDIKNGLKTQFLGQEKIYIYDETDSTNEQAYRFAMEGAPEGTLVISESQSSGRGRSGRRWVSVPEQSLSFSIVLRPAIDPSVAPGLTLTIAVALSDSLHEFGIHNHRIKWPNDILINNKKISGILTELNLSAEKIGFIIAGIGINTGSVKELMPPELQGIASSIYDETGMAIDRVRFMQSILYNIEKRYTDFIGGRFDEIITLWEENAGITGRMISAEINRQFIKGKVTGINSDGSLSIETGSGSMRLDSGEITLL